MDLCTKSCFRCPAANKPLAGVFLCRSQIASHKPGLPLSSVRVLLLVMSLIGLLRSQFAVTLLALHFAAYLHPSLARLH